MKRQTSSMRKDGFGSHSVFPPGAVLVIAFLALIIVCCFLYSLGESSDVTGTIVGIHGEPTREGNIIYFLVALEQGTVVKTKMPIGIEIKKGARVILAETDTRLFGLKRYRFRKYLEVVPEVVNPRM